MIYHKKNTAYYLSFPMVDSSIPSSYKTGLSVAITAYYKDGASAWASLSIADSVSEIGSTGVYQLDLLAAELNHDLAFIKFTATGAADTAFQFNMINNDNIVDQVYDEAFSGHNIAGSFGRLIKNLSDGVVSADSSVNDVSATVNTFVTNLTEATDSHYSDHTLVFIDGNLKGQCKPILSYNGTTKTIVLDEDLTEAPADGDSFLILSIHIHPVTQIAQGVRTEIDANSTQLSAILADTAEIGTAGAGLTDLGGMSSAMKAEVNAEADTAITDAALATAANLDTVDTVVDGIKAVTDLLPDAGALSSIATAASLATIDSNVDAILVDTGATIPAQIAALQDLSLIDVLDTQLTESYAAAGANPTVRQILFLVQQLLGDFSISGNTLTAHKLDGVTAAANFTLNDPVNPTSIKRSS